MRTTALVAIIVSALFCAPAFGETTKLPKSVASDLKGVAAECAGAGGKAITDNAIKKVDLTADGKDDFILDVGSINCDGAAAIYGDREKGVTVYVANAKGGAKKAFSDSVYGVKVEGKKVWLTVSGTQCGKKPAVDFASENFCDRSIVWDVKKKKFDFAPVSTVRMIQ